MTETHLTEILDALDDDQIDSITVIKLEDGKGVPGPNYIGDGSGSGDA